MRTVHTLLAVLLSLLIGSAHALTAPVVKVDRTIPIPAAGISNGMVDFVPFATASLTYQITNTGNMPLAIHAPTITRINGANVIITTSPLSPLGAGSTTNLVISVTPIGPTGNWDFLVTFGNTDLLHNPFSWTVRNGVPVPEINVTYHEVNLPDDSPTTLEVGPPATLAPSYSNYTFIVTNTGSGPLTISAIVFGGFGDSGVVLSRVSPLVLPAVIAPGGQLAVVVNAVAQQVQNWRGTVTIINDDGATNNSERNYNFTMSGTYESDPTFAGEGEVRLSGPTGVLLSNNDIARTVAGSSQVGVPTTYTLTIWNMSRVDSLHVLYPIVTTTPLVYGPAVTIVPKKLPTDAGPINATAIIPGGTPIGNVATNPAGTILTDGVSGFILVGPWPYPFPPQTVSFTVEVTPTKEGFWSVPIRFRTNDFIGVIGEDPFTINLQGDAVGVPDLSITNRGTTLSTSGVIATNILSAVGFTNAHSFVVTNTGTGTLLLDNTLITSSLANCSLVGLPTVNATAVGPGGKATFTVRTTPGIMAPWSAAFSLTSSDPLPTPITVTVSGTATPPRPELDVFQASTPVPVGGTAAISTSLVGQGTQYTITKQNSGTGLLTISGAGVGVVTNCTATIVQPSSFPATVIALDPSISIPLVVNVSPLAVGPWSVALTVNSDDLDEAIYTFTLSGVATKLNPQDQCGLGSGFSLLLLMLVGALLPLVARRR